MATEMSIRYASVLRASSLKEIAGWADCAQEATTMKADELIQRETPTRLLAADHYLEADKWAKLGELLTWAAGLAEGKED